MIRLSLIALAVAALTTHCIGPADAQTAEPLTAAEATAVLCPKHLEITPAIEAAAARNDVEPVVLVAVALMESSCNPRRKNKLTGCYGLMGIKVDGSANPVNLSPAELMDPETSAELGARHLRRLLDSCGSLALALGQYHSRKKCPARDGYARRVLGLVEWARERVWRLREARS